MTEPRTTITIRPDEDERPGWTEVALSVDESVDGSADGAKRASRCGILALSMRIGAATVRMDGIGGVDTEEAYRHRGLARQVLEAAISHMSTGDAALTMLYGIVDFYPKFGYVTAGPDHRLTLPLTGSPTDAPAGWAVRAFDPSDLPMIMELFDATLSDSSGAVVRDPDQYPWTRLRGVAEEARTHECRVVTGPDGDVRAYAWRGRGCGFVEGYENDDPDQLIIAEAIAADPAAAEVLLDACHAWAREEAEHEKRAITDLGLIIAPEGLVAAAAQSQTSVASQKMIATGGSMVRVLDVARLLHALKPELDRRVAAARLPWTGTLEIVTDIGSAALTITHDAVHVAEGSEPTTATLNLPQTALARLALGVLDPAELLTALDDPPVGDVATALTTLFPRRNPHLSLLDRY